MTPTVVPALVLFALIVAFGHWYIFLAAYLIFLGVAYWWSRRQTRDRGRPDPGEAAGEKRSSRGRPRG
jgi:hypothetical protein